MNELTPHQLEVAAREINAAREKIMVSDRDLVLKAIGIASTLTYNEEPEGAAKHIIQELAHRLWTRAGCTGRPGDLQAVIPSDMRRPLNCDQVAWMLAAFGRYLPRPTHPAVSRATDMQRYGLLYEVMEVANLRFEDAAARSNGTPIEVREPSPANNTCDKAALAAGQRAGEE